MGVAVSGCCLHAWLWAHRHRDRLAPWAAAWCAATLVGLIGHYVQITAADPGRAVLGARLAWVGAMLLLPITIGVAHGLSGHSVPRRILLAAICTWCKKVRNDRNYWESIESYIAQRSRATFSHGICPDCRQKVVMSEIERWKRERGPAG
jgi:hypothetical protein